MKTELIKELYDSIDRVNQILLNEEFTDYTKCILLKEEESKQIRLRQFLIEWENNVSY